MFLFCLHLLLHTRFVNIDIKLINKISKFFLSPPFPAPPPALASKSCRQSVMNCWRVLKINLSVSFPERISQQQTFWIPLVQKVKNRRRTCWLLPINDFSAVVGWIVPCPSPGFYTFNWRYILNRDVKIMSSKKLRIRKVIIYYFFGKLDNFCFNK